MNPKNKRSAPKPVPDPAASRQSGLTEELRIRIGQKRQLHAVSLRELGKLVGVTAAQLQRIERGTKHPTPSLLLRILSVLGFEEADLEKALDETPECWVARRLSSLFPAPEKLGAVLERGRTLSGISRGELAKRASLSLQRLSDIEEGCVKPSPGLLVTLVRAWGLPIESLQTLLPASPHSSGGVAERFLQALLEQQGFEVTSPEDDSGLSVKLGGEWSLRVQAALVKTKTKHETKR